MDIRRVYIKKGERFVEIPWSLIEDKGEQIVVVTEDYTPISHDEAVRIAENWFAAARLRTELVLDFWDIKKLYRLYRVEKLKFEIDRAIFNIGIALRNSIDRSWAFSLQLRPYKLSCANDFPVSVPLWSYYKRHVGRLEIPLCLETLHRLEKYLDLMKQKLEALKEVKLDLLAVWQDYPKWFQKLLARELESSTVTGYNYLDAVTRLIQHDRVTFGMRRRFEAIALRPIRSVL